MFCKGVGLSLFSLMLKFLDVLQQSRVYLCFKLVLKLKMYEFEQVLVWAEITAEFILLPQEFLYFAICVLNSPYFAAN